MAGRVRMAGRPRIGDTSANRGQARRALKRTRLVGCTATIRFNERSRLANWDRPATRINKGQVRTKPEFWTSPNSGPNSLSEPRSRSLARLRTGSAGLPRCRPTSCTGRSPGSLGPVREGPPELGTAPELGTGPNEAGPNAAGTGFARIGESSKSIKRA